MKPSERDRPDDRALELAAGQPGLRVQRSPGGGLVLAGQQDALDALVLVLGDACVIIRRLDLLVSPLESMFFALTAGEVPDELEPHDLAQKVLAVA